jgi:hypothetical protein
MELRTGTLTFVRSRGCPNRSESRSFNFCDSLQQAVSCLTGSNSGFLPRKEHRLMEGRLVEQPTFTIAMSCSQLPSSEFVI